MKALCQYAVIVLALTGCASQSTLPHNSVFNVTSVLNDTAWYGTGKVLRLREAEQKLDEVRAFNLVVFTDIDYPGMGDPNAPNPNTENGCVDPECTRTQGLVIYNIPLKKGRFKISTLDKRKTLKNEYASLSYIGNSGGLHNLYTYQGLKPGWIKVTNFDKNTGIVEGRFAISFSQYPGDDLLLTKTNMAPTAMFKNGLFRIKLTDVLLR